MKHFCTALAIFATSINALHLDQDGTQGLGPHSVGNTDASANTNRQATPHMHTQVNEDETSSTDNTDARVDILEAMVEEL